ncbi:MAG: hypothetical protein WAM58_16385 [Candidatus Acidiferrum sp.]
MRRSALVMTLKVILGMFLALLVPTPATTQEPAPPVQELKDVFPKNRPILHMQIATSLNASTGATRTYTLLFPWMQVRSAAV